MTLVTRAEEWAAARRAARAASGAAPGGYRNGLRGGRSEAGRRPDAKAGHRQPPPAKTSLPKPGPSPAAWRPRSSRWSGAFWPPAQATPTVPYGRVVVQILDDPETLEALLAPGARETLVTPPLTTDHLIRTKSLPLWIDALRYDGPAQPAERVAAAVEAYCRGIRGLSGPSRRRNAGGRADRSIPVRGWS